MISNATQVNCKIFAFSDWLNDLKVFSVMVNLVDVHQFLNIFQLCRTQEPVDIFLISIKHQLDLVATLDLIKLHHLMIFHDILQLHETLF